MDNRIADVIQRAIKNEEDAYSFYNNLYTIVEDKQAKETLLFLAEQEKQHKEFLMKYLAGEYKEVSMRKEETLDYKIAQYVDAPDINKNMNTIEVYLVAAHRELNSYNFYRNLAKLQPEGTFKEILTKMANEELHHKEKVEYLYSNSAFPQTAGG